MSQTRISTGNPTFDDLIPRIQGFLSKDTMDMNIDGQAIRGYRSPDTPAVWIRDHSDIMRGGRFFEKDLQSAVQHFADTQARNGRIFDYFTVQPEKVPCEKENWCKYVRVPVEADVEYRFVKAVHIAWQSAGDDAWARSLIPNMEAALTYAFSHPQRWDADKQLVKRPYTIDSWDFAYSAGSHDWLQFQIDENTFWGIMHGDNSGYYEACMLLAKMLDAFQEPPRAQHWREKAAALKRQMNQHCWNGSFYTHFVKETPVTIEGADEASQLSFSNAMNINRGVATHEQAVSILQEYLKRREHSGAFAEWFSIDPAFPDGIFGEEKIVGGAYCNGGIMPLVGGELAKAYFQHGMEAEGLRTLETYSKLTARKNETFLWYFPDGTESSVDTSTSPDATPTDGWGSSAMLYGLIEGLAGIEDHGKGFDKVHLSPRWHAAGESEVEASVSYAASGAGFGYSYQENNDSVQLHIDSPKSEISLHLQVPSDAEIGAIKVGSQHIEYRTLKVEGSQYVDCVLNCDGGQAVTVQFK